MGKANLFPDFKELFELLNSARVKYRVLGGYAVIHYGYRRATDDLDIWISPERENAEKVSQALQGFGFAAAKVRPSMFVEKGRVFVIGREPTRVDLLTQPSGVDFETCYARRNMVEWDGVPIPLVSLEDLRANKQASGREKDLADMKGLSSVETRQASAPPKRRPKARRPRKS
jgi:hypothetical protein